MRYCLIIDDTKQDEEILAIEALGKKKRFPIKCYYFNPKKKECLREEKKPDGSSDFFLDEELVFLELQKSFPSQQIDLIATDYKLNDDKNGLDIVKYLKNNNWRGETPYVIYSGDSHEIKEKLQKSISELIGDKDELNKFVEGYYDSNPCKIFKRSTKVKDSHISHIYEFIRNNKSPLNNKLSQKLNQHPERVFKNIFTRFEGRKLKILAQLVLKNSEESDAFEDEFIDRCVDHFIDLKE